MTPAKTESATAGPKAPTPKERPLWNRDFILLNAVMFITFCNMAVFFGLNSYLKSLGMSQAQSGWLIGVYALVALIIRPFISLKLNAGNSRRWLMISCLSVVVTLALYNVPRDFIGLLTVRLLHGMAYVVLATSAMALMVEVIPPKRSGQAFGFMAVVTLLPYAVIPPLAVELTERLGGYLPVLNLTAFLMLFIILLAYMLKMKTSSTGRPEEKPLGFGDLKASLKDRRILMVLLVSLTLYTTFTPAFYYIKGYAHQLGIANAGWFFTISTGSEISVRLFLGRWFDRLDKDMILRAVLVILALAFIGLANTSGQFMFFGLAVVLGLAWGAGLPLINSLLFDYSTPRFRALNANLGLQVFQAGFFFGPMFGGLLLSLGGYDALFRSSCLLCLVGAGLTFTLRKAENK